MHVHAVPMSQDCRPKTDRLEACPISQAAIGPLAPGARRLSRDSRPATFSLDSPFDGLLLSMDIAMMKRYPNPYFWYWHKPSGGLRPLP